MKKFLAAFLILNFLYMNYLPVFASENKTKKPRVSTFNKAIKKGDIEKVQDYIEAGANPNAKYLPLTIAYGTPVIGTAIIKKDNQMLELLLENGANVNPQSICSPILLAIIKNNTYAVKRLIQEGADINQIYLGYTMQAYGMSEAIRKNNYELLDAFLDNGADPNSKYSVPLLYYAVTQKNSYAVEKLIIKGANQDETYAGQTPEFLAYHSNIKEITEIFKKYDKKGNLIIHTATNLNDATNLLQDTILGPIFYDYIKGKNPTNQEFLVEYKDLKTLYKKYENLYGVTWEKNKKRFIFIDKKYRTSSPEALACLIAALSIHQDNYNSINEEAYSAMLQAALWANFTHNNPSLRLEQSHLVKTLNYYEAIYKDNDYNINNFIEVIKRDPKYKNLPKTSPGFSNDDIDLITDESKMKQVASNIASYCHKHDIGSKIKTSCEIIALRGLIALEVLILDPISCL